ncbi:MAG: immunoglobulin domain-containing protein, partial [Rhodoglobus sp.]|nr:immunoglobulin domain-containing protein [Rhodoglobus sp.]
TVRSWGSTGVVRTVVDLASSRSVAAIAAGDSHSVALLGDGTVTAWIDPTYASADFGQAAVPAGLGGVVAIATGRIHNLALLSDGTVRAWGHDFYGQSTVPAGLTDVIAIAAADGRSLAVRADGTVVRWGEQYFNDYGGGFGKLRNVVAVAAGPSYGVALKSDGTVAGWGGANYGELNIPPGLDRITHLSANSAQVLALRGDGTVVAWGSEGPSHVTTPSVLSNVSALWAGGSRSSYVLVDGSIVLRPATEVVLPGLGAASAIVSASDRYLALVDAVAPAVASEPGDQAVMPGQTATFTVAATGTPALAYQWTKDGVIIPGATTATLAINGVQSVNSGRYSVTVSNPFGAAVSRAAALGGVNPAPVVTTHPQTTTALAGTSASLGVVATGVGSLTYQWRRNGVPVPGLTSASIAFVGLSFFDSASYDVAIMDGLSLVVSQPAVLTVVPASYPHVVSAAPSFAPFFENAGGYPGGFYRLTGGKVIVFGSFSRLNGTMARNVARLNADGTLDASFGGSLIDGTVYAVVAQSDGKLVIGGIFNRVAGQARAGLARLNVDGTLDASFAPTANFYGVFALDVQDDGKIVVGGGFASALARVRADGTADESFAAPAPNGSVNAL